MARRSSWAMLAMGVMAALWMGGCAREPEKPRETSNPPLVKHVLIVSIDGCRPDVLLRAQIEAAEQGEHPMISELMAEGSFTMWARTIPESITLPSHTSMLTGVSAQVHGITWNEVKGDAFVFPNVPTLFDVAKQHGLTTSIFAGKYKFHTFCKPGAIDWGYITPEGHGDYDSTIADVAADTIMKHKPNLIFMHLAMTDIAGHATTNKEDHFVHGWGTPLQIEVLRFADEAIRKVVDALKVAGIYDETLIIITADHGGQGLSHGPDDARSRHIPWICVGPGVKKNFDLTRLPSLWIKTEDTFATASYFLGLPIDNQVEGRPVTEVIHDFELTKDR